LFFAEKRLKNFAFRWRKAAKSLSTSFFGFRRKRLKKLFSLLFGGEKQQKPHDRFRCRRPED